MAKMNLFNSSCQADEICLVYCKAQANMYLDCDNASLVRLKTVAGHEHLVWMDETLAAQGVYSYVRAFYEPQEWAEDDLSDVKYRIFMRPDKDVFCFNGNVYFLYAAQNKNYQIRRLKAYAMQYVVEEIERQTYENKFPDAIFLSNFYTLDGKSKNYALTCWGIAYQEGCNYLPVFDEDRHYLEECQLSQFTREELSVGTVFKNNGYYYKVLKGADGRLGLEQAKSVFMLGKSDDFSKEQPTQKATIISFDFKNKKQSGG
ncbi:MAG: hypothetical protein IJ738_01330 [Alphaproteobacteria bacterium]|nr:hypothetical protein [Alphaproteobacteria bacterium]